MPPDISVHSQVSGMVGFDESSEEQLLESQLQGPLPFQLHLPEGQWGIQHQCLKNDQKK